MKTIKDVAAYSGVSLTTVSRVVNGSDKVSPKTKAKVDQAIKELGYFPNNAARSLVSHCRRISAGPSALCARSRWTAI